MQLHVLHSVVGVNSRNPWVHTGAGGGLHHHSSGLAVILQNVTGFGKTLRMGSTRNSCNACFWCPRSKTVKVQILSYPCHKTFLLTVTIVYGG